MWCGRDDAASGGVLDLSHRRSGRTTESRLRCSTRDLENNVCVWARSLATRVRGGRSRRAGLRSRARTPDLWSSAGVDARSRHWAETVLRVPGGCGARTGRGLGRQVCAWCAGGRASGGSDSRGGSFSSPRGPPRAPRLRKLVRFPSFLYRWIVCVRRFSRCT